MSTSDAPVDTTFDGSNWEALTRLETLSRMKFLQTEDFDNDEPARCAYLSSFFRGPALDWVGAAYAQNNQIFANFDGFVQGAKEQFGIDDAPLRAHWRSQLEDLKWQADLPLFFAEFDRLTSLLGVEANLTKIALLRNKLPSTVQRLLAEQALDFEHYGTMRQRLITMWALDPNKKTAVGQTTTSTRRPRCGRCHKRGHTAADCRSKN